MNNAHIITVLLTVINCGTGITDSVSKVLSSSPFDAFADPMFL